MEMKFKDFEIREPVFILGFEPEDKDYFKYNFDLVKWRLDKEGKKYCYSIAFLHWNSEEADFDFKSVGTRYLEDREEGLEEWLLKWCELKTVEFRFQLDD